MVGFDDETIARLFDAGFDDYESLSLAGVDSLKLLGFKDAEIMYSKIKYSLEDVIETSPIKGPAKGILDQDGTEIDDL